MKIGLAQINTTVGDLEGNAQIILESYNRLLEEGAELVVFPELALCGYPPRDLLLKSRFASDVQATLDRIAEKIGAVPALIGTVEIAPEGSSGRPLYNAAAWCESGSIHHYARKSLLPNYDVFDEERYFEPASKPLILKWNKQQIGITICEDIWSADDCFDRKRYHQNPIDALAKHSLDLVINLSASPWHINKEQSRQNLIQKISQQLACPVLYCNAIGGNDELIFDGDSFVIDPKIGLIAQLPKFESALECIDLNRTKAIPAKLGSSLQNMNDALVLGLKDYAHKTGFKRGLVGLSGGIDSAVVAALATEALGAKNILGVALPSAISSTHSVEDAQALAENLGIDFKILPIAESVQSIEASLAPIFSDQERDVTEENIQARLRGVQLMALSNKLNRLLLTTGNKSEIAVGYCTLYGDMCGGLAVISDVPKMQVYALAEQINHSREIIPQNTLDKPPSAELSPDQKDADSLPPYPELDAILQHYVEDGRSRSEIIAEGFDAETVNNIVQKVDRNEYKRKQAAPGLKISSLAFGIGRRMPIVQKYTN